MLSSYLVLFKQTAVKLFVVFVILGLVACGGGDDPKPEGEEVVGGAGSVSREGKEIIIP